MSVHVSLRITVAAAVTFATAACRAPYRGPVTWEELRFVTAAEPQERQLSEAMDAAVFWTCPGPPWESVDPFRAARSLWSSLSRSERLAALQASPELRATRILTRICLGNLRHWVRTREHSRSLDEIIPTEFLQYLDIVYGPLPYSFSYEVEGERWSARATPRVDGLRHLFIDETGVIRFENDRDATRESTPIDA